MLGKRLIHLPASGKREIVSNQRIGRDVRQRQLAPQTQQLVFRRHHHAAIPVVARQRDQVIGLGHRFGGDGDIRFAAVHHVDDLRRIALMNTQRHLGVAFAEGFDGVRQGIARLRVRGGDGERAFGFVRELAADFL